jgi:putative transposase
MMAPPDNQNMSQHVNGCDNAAVVRLFRYLKTESIAGQGDKIVIYAKQDLSDYIISKTIISKTKISKIKISQVKPHHQNVGLSVNESERRSWLDSTAVAKFS